VATFDSVDPTPRRESGQLYIDPWVPLARRRMWGFAGFALVLVGLIFFVCKNTVVAIGLAVFGLPLMAYSEDAKCPRCGKRFARRWLTHNIFTPKCLNCGTRFGDVIT
jgi:DNA-directed RNA polymerase subunit RPC12/RpoP